MSAISLFGSFPKQVLPIIQFEHDYFRQVFQTDIYDTAIICVIYIKTNTRSRIRQVSGSQLDPTACFIEIKLYEARGQNISQHA
jgi:hypothetical protein